MPIGNIARSAGIYAPEDLDLLSRVITRCLSGAESDSEKEEIALAIITHFSQGLLDEEELVAKCRRPARR
jgi:hypothetical protein